MPEKATARERALWTFLIATLAAPFLAALAVLAAGSAIGLLGRWLPPEMATLDMGGRMRWAGALALAAFVWSAWPAALAGAAAAALISWRNRLDWLDCAVLGAAASTLSAFLSAGVLLRHLLPIAFLGALLGVAIWSVLMRARIIR